MAMEHEVRHRPPKSDKITPGYFFVKENDKTVCKLRYVLISTTKTFVIQTTWIHSKYKSKGIREAVIMAAVNWCREHEHVILAHDKFCQVLFYLVRETEDAMVKVGFEKHTTSGIRKFR